MSDSPYAPPAARVADRSAAPPIPRPRQVTIAVAMLWVSFAIGIPLWYLMMARDPDVGSQPVLAVVGVVIFVLSAVLNVLVYRGRNWARIVLLVLVALASIMLLVPIEEPVPPGALEQTLNAVSTVVEIAALFLLFTRPGSLWFRPRDPA